MPCAAWQFGNPAILDRISVHSPSAPLIIIGVSFISFYGSFIPQLVARDRAEFRDARGKVTAARLGRKIGEYFAYMVSQEFITTPMRLAALAVLTRSFGLSNSAANISSFLAVCLTFSFGIFPLIREGVKDLRRARQKKGEVT